MVGKEQDDSIWQSEENKRHGDGVWKYTYMSAMK